MTYARKDYPLFSGPFTYFPDALMQLALLCKLGNDKHNPGEPLHWAREKSTDHPDCAARHLLGAGKLDPETGLTHTVSLLWRAAAMVQLECEARVRAQPFHVMMSGRIETQAECDARVKAEAQKPEPVQLEFDFDGPAPEFNFPVLLETDDPAPLEHPQPWYKEPVRLETSEEVEPETLSWKQARVHMLVGGEVRLEGESGRGTLKWYYDEDVDKFMYASGAYGRGKSSEFADDASEYVRGLRYVAV